MKILMFAMIAQGAFI